MLQVGFEPTISAGERPKTYALDRAATGTGNKTLLVVVYYKLVSKTGTLVLITYLFVLYV